MNHWLPVIAGTGAAAAGGFYLAFSALVMPAFRGRPASEATAAMAAINGKAVRPPFMILFFGTAAACAAIALGWVTDPPAQSPLRIAGAAAYLTGWASTMLVNVPLNKRLARMQSDKPDQHWKGFEQAWTPANHVRAALSIAGAVALLIPVYRQ